jgi:ribose 5-phosphate isomerase A
MRTRLRLIVISALVEFRTVSASQMAELSAADKLKRDAGYQSVDAHIKSGMAVGLGTGSTAYFAVERLGQKLRAGELSGIKAIPTSERTREQAESLGIPLVTLDECDHLDVAIDGADAVDPSLNLIKGGGGAMHREKMVAMRADKFVTIVDESKLCDGLGPSFPLPVRRNDPHALLARRGAPSSDACALQVEITPFCAKCTMRTIEKLPSLAGCQARLRTGSAANNKVRAATLPSATGDSAFAPTLSVAWHAQVEGDEPAVTDNGNYVVDLVFQAPISDPVQVSRMQHPPRRCAVQREPLTRRCRRVCLAGRRGAQGSRRGRRSRPLLQHGRGGDRGGRGRCVREDALRVARCGGGAPRIPQPAFTAWRGQWRRPGCRAWGKPEGFQDRALTSVGQ